MPARYVLGWRLIWGVTLHQFLRDVLVKDILHGQGNDDFVAALEKGFDLLQRIRRIIERYEETFLAIFAHHHGFKAVNVRATDLVFLFYLDGIPAFFQAEFAFLLLARRGTGGNGEDAAIHAHVADLHFVRDAAEGNDGPVLKFKRRQDAQFLARPRQVADDETASGFPERLAFRQTANIAQALGHDAAGGGRNINANPLAFQILRRDEFRAATAKGIQHDVVLVAACLKNPLQ